MTSLNRFFTVFFALLVGIPAAISADDDQYKISDERIDTIKSTIAKSVMNKEDLTNSAVIQSIYDKIGAEMPLTPKESIVEVDLKELNAKALVKAQKKFKDDPEKLKAKFAAEAEKMYPMAKLRDKVTVPYRFGSVSGILYKINSNNILVNNTTIPFIDMEKQTRSRFDKQFNEALRAKYMQDCEVKFRSDFERYKQKVFEDLLTNANAENEKNGYIFLKRREIWKTAKEITAIELEPEIERYRKAKEKQERQRRKREAKEKAAREAKEKAEAEAKAAEQQQQEKKTDESNGKSALAQNLTGALPIAPDEGKMAENFDPQDIFNSENPSDAPQTDEGGNFIALTPEQLAALSRPRVNETTYKTLMAKIEKKLEEINSKYYGIDADQGFKKALWGFSATDVYYALSKEPDAPFIKPSINVDYIQYPEGSRPQKVYLHYYLGQLYRVQTFLGNLKQHEFNLYKNSLQQKYGESDTQSKMGNDVFLRLADGSLSPAGMPPFVRITPEGSDEYKSNESKQPAPAPQKTDDQTAAGNTAPAAGAQQESGNRFHFVWEGRLSRGVLSFRYDPQTQIYSNVIFEKVYLPERLKKLEEKPSAAPAESAPKAQ